MGQLGWEWVKFLLTVLTVHVTQLANPAKSSLVLLFSISQTPGWEASFITSAFSPITTGMPLRFVARPAISARLLARATSSMWTVLAISATTVTTSPVVRIRPSTTTSAFRSSSASFSLMRLSSAASKLRSACSGFEKTFTLLMYPSMSAIFVAKDRR